MLTFLKDTPFLQLQNLERQPYAIGAPAFRSYIHNHLQGKVLHLEHYGFELPMAEGGGLSSLEPRQAVCPRL